jgi:hypothetical protein
MNRENSCLSFNKIYKKVLAITNMGDSTDSGNLLDGQDIFFTLEDENPEGKNQEVRNPESLSEFGTETASIFACSLNVNPGILIAELDREEGAFQQRIGSVFSGIRYEGWTVLERLYDFRDRLLDLQLKIKLTCLRIFPLKNDLEAFRRTISELTLEREIVQKEIDELEGKGAEELLLFEEGFTRQIEAAESGVQEKEPVLAREAAVKMKYEEEFHSLLRAFISYGKANVSSDEVREKILGLRRFLIAERDCAARGRSNSY